MKTVKLCFVLLLIALISAQGKPYSSLKKALKYPGDQNIDVKFYALDLDIRPSTQYLAGNTLIKLKMKTDLTSFYLDLSNNLKVDSVFINSLKKTFTHSENKINFSSLSFKKDEIIDVKVFYQGKPASTGLGSFVFKQINGKDYIWTLSESYGTSDWFVCKDSPEDKADSADIKITVPEKLTAVSNGKLFEEKNNGNGTKTFLWKTRYPIAQYLISIAVAEYEKYTNYFKYTEKDSMPIEHYSWSGNLTEARKKMFDLTPYMLKTYSDLFGLYPFIKEKYGHADFGWDGGMEHQTISSMIDYSEDLMIHELAHQWFGDKITCKDWNSIWLNEGFATYSEALYYEVKYGKGAYDGTIKDYMNYATYAQGSIYLNDISSDANIFDYYLTYAKGCVVLHMLRGVTGKEKFLQILKNYINDPELVYTSTGIDSFIKHAEAVHGSSLKWYFDEWIYGENYPKYNFTWNSTNTSDGRFRVNINVKQQLNNNPAFFTMPIQIKIYTNTKDTLVTVFNNSADQNFEFVLSENVIKIEPDPDNLIMKGIISVTDIEKESNIEIPQKFELMQNFPNPFNPATVIAFTLPEKCRVELKVFDILGKEVKTLADEEFSSGKYSVKFDAGNLPSGIFLYRIKAGNYSVTKRMVLVK